MQIFVNTTNNIPISAAHRAAMEALITEALAKIENVVMSVSVFLSDHRGEKTGGGVSCRMVAEVPTGPAVVTEDTASSLELAAGTAAEELVVRIRKYWDRRHTKDRHVEAVVQAAPAADSIDASEIISSLS